MHLELVEPENRSSAHRVVLRLSHFDTGVRIEEWGDLQRSLGAATLTANLSRQEFLNMTPRRSRGQQRRQSPSGTPRCSEGTDPAAAVALHPRAK